MGALFKLCCNPRTLDVPLVGLHVGLHIGLHVGLQVGLKFARASAHCAEVMLSEGIHFRISNFELSKCQHFNRLKLDSLDTNCVCKKYKIVTNLCNIKYIGKSSSRKLRRVINYLLYSLGPQTMH